MPGIRTPPGAGPQFGAVLRCLECPPVGATPWANMVLAYERLPRDRQAQIADLRARHGIEASFGAAMPIEKRLALRADIRPRHPVVRIPVTGEKIFCERLHHALHQLSPQRRCVGRDHTHGSNDDGNYLISQAQIPEVPGALALEAQQHRYLGQQRHAAYAVMDCPASVRRWSSRNRRRKPFDH